MLRHTLFAFFIAVLLAGCGKSLDSQIPGQWEGEFGMATFTPDGWMYDHNLDNLLCWSVTNGSMTVREPCAPLDADDIVVQVAIDGDTMTVTSDGDVVSFKRVGETTVLPEEARRLLAAHAADLDPTVKATATCRK